MSYTLFYRRGSFPISENFEDLRLAVLRGKDVAQLHQAYCISIMKEAVPMMSQAEILFDDVDLDQTIIFGTSVSGADKR